MDCEYVYPCILPCQQMARGKPNFFQSSRHSGNSVHSLLLLLELLSLPQPIAYQRTDARAARLIKCLTLPIGAGGQTVLAMALARNPEASAQRSRNTLRPTSTMGACFTRRVLDMRDDPYPEDPFLPEWVV